jgi:hypothetical protein
MIETLVYLVIYIVVLGLVLYLLDVLIQNVPMFEPFRAVARTVLMVLGCLILILLVLQLIGGGSFRLPRLT